ncbi:MAG: hypothetical protein GY727_12215 [Gammaproteobacteria bacterium]|nr:hypothetical protein [Gammaproteobacteria bacterium]MCP4091555.1 hypothetical protein [Gammaproteobacteria bacterium]MCP4929385.1 hypothetical protein [Gammaproteobacteria bacterium]
MNNIRNKPFWKSKTVWGALLAAVPVIGPALSAALLTASTGNTEQLTAIPAELQAILAAIGACLAIYGRWKASGELTLK